ncbi:MAG TPA: PAS domain S-box protein [Solirubrobacteraceae bacterium]|nr:PAS domain S-box protein [Solirubrobacteraceae bacterium]
METRFEVLLESAPDAILLVDARGRVVLVNRRAEEFFGYAPGALVGHEVELLVPGRFRGRHLVHRAGYIADPRTREMGAGLELYGRRKDGSEFPVEISLSATQVDGDQLVIAILRDVSERRAAELERQEVAREQAALRRVATLVARAALPEELFAGVTEEVGRLLRADHAHLGRYESEDTVEILADWSRQGEPFPVGARFRLGGEDLCTLVAQAGRPARIDSYPDASGPLAVATAERGFRSGAGAPIMVEDHIWGVMITGSTLENPLPPDTEARLASFTELVAMAIANADSRADLAASRGRVVAAADETRRRIERDLHDGVQQRLISVSYMVRAAQEATPPALGELAAELSRVAEELRGVQDDLREISRGIHPAVLAEGGLRPALETLARSPAIRVELTAHLPEGRLPEAVEVTAYYVASEALTNATKHAQARVVNLDVEHADGVVRLCVRDDGIGGADFARGSGLVGLKDRVEAIGGAFSLRSLHGAGTRLDVVLPLDKE